MDSDLLVMAAVRALKKKRAVDIARLIAVGITEDEIEFELTKEIERVLQGEDFEGAPVSAPTAAATRVTPKQFYILQAIERGSGQATLQQILEILTENGVIHASRNATATIAYRIRDLQRMGLILPVPESSPRAFTLTTRGKNLLGEAGQAVSHEE